MDDPENLDFAEMTINDDKLHIPLKECVDLEELRRTDGKGCEFEIDEDQLPQSNQGQNNFFDNEDLYKNLTSASLMRAEDDENETSGDEDLSFEKLALKMEDISGDGGVRKKIIKHGLGEVVSTDNSVKVHYNGFLEYSDEPYDSSRLRNRPQHFRLGSGEVIPGMDVAVSTMRKGELSQFLVSFEYAFGEKGVPPRIPQEATILFEIELIHFSEDCIDDRLDKDATFKEVLTVVNSLRQNGNDLFKAKIFPKAFSRYQKAHRLLEDVHLQNDDEEKEMKAMMLKVCLNMSLCSFKMGKAPRTVTFANKAIAIDDKNAKAHFRKGQALITLGDFKRARVSLKSAQRLAPNDGDVIRELHKLEKASERFKGLEKDMCERMFRPKDLKEAPKESATREEPKEFKISNDFEEQIMKGLTEFKAEESTQKVFPCSTFNKNEKEFIVKKAESLGYRARVAEETTGYEVIKVNKPLDE
ncbi:inactive peptidyl-prolyl cis-trans isomerase FKBP6-like [Antedon mediterranea]|uniref:inactive peptidyl-prolyl cis-trans isomerase FKBP6-like n=1 Tax=Antedon mediterranea TaxID=105859 RepID=UPI003AF6DD81